MRSSSVCVILLGSLLLAQVHTAAAVTADVNWLMIPVVKVSGKGRSYNASSKLLKLCKGDSVKFHWAGGLPHDVVTVAAAAWSTCGLAGKKGVAALGVSGSKTVKYAAGSKTYSYLCSVPGHCSAGQKLRVSVSSKC